VLIAEKAHDDGHAAHSLSVMTLALLLGKQAKLPQQALCSLGVGALLHDIGKLAIKPAILRNSERNRHEELIYQTHCRTGHDEARRAGNLSPPLLHAILHHHERFDGSGFPDHLSGGAIPLSARLVAIANRFDNLVSPVDCGARCRPPRPCRRCGRASRRASTPPCCNSSFAPWASIRQGRSFNSATAASARSSARRRRASRSRRRS
jgi:hypothetical protein